MTRGEVNIEFPSTETTLEEWWSAERSRQVATNRRAFDTLVCTASWYLWKNRNAWAFANVSKQSTVEQLATKICDEFVLCLVARRSGVGDHNVA